MSNPETHTCPTCGYTWKYGEHGGHHCPDYLTKDIEFLLNRAKKAGSCFFTADRDTGQSSNALVTFAYTGDVPTEWPSDDQDYGACVRASLALPDHRRTPKVVEMLGKMKLKVEQRKAARI